ncbi:succinate dehydrogenase, partial [Streptomyces niveus]
MALATRTDKRADRKAGAPGGGRPGKRPSMLGTLWGSTVGKKAVMAVSGLILLGYLVAHLLGNLKIFFGPGEFNEYGHWLRTMGAPVLH